MEGAPESLTGAPSNPAAPVRTEHQFQLVSPAAARVILGVTREQFGCMLDDGRLRWAFDLSRPGCRCRVIRVWAMELYHPESVRALDWNAGISQILPWVHRSRLRATELSQLLDLAHPALWDRLKAGLLSSNYDSRARWIPLTEIRAWLAAAWLSKPAAAISSFPQ
jgi:hypothetical protein